MYIFTESVCIYLLFNNSGNNNLNARTTHDTRTTHDIHTAHARTHTIADYTNAGEDTAGAMKNLYRENNKRQNMRILNVD